MENIKSISYYASSYDLIRDYFGQNVFCGNGLTEDQEDFLRGVDDYESVCFYVLNDNTVLICDSVSGDVIGEPVSLDEFKENMFEFVKESEE